MQGSVSNYRPLGAPEACRDKLGLRVGCWTSVSPSLTAANGCVLHLAAGMRWARASPFEWLYTIDAVGLAALGTRLRLATSPIVGMTPECSRCLYTRTSLR